MEERRGKASFSLTAMMEYEPDPLLTHTHNMDRLSSLFLFLSDFLSCFLSILPSSSFPLCDPHWFLLLSQNNVSSSWQKVFHLTFGLCCLLKGTLRLD